MKINTIKLIHGQFINNYEIIALSKCNSIISTISPYDSNFTTINKKKETDLCKHISVDMISC